MRFKIDADLYLLLAALCGRPDRVLEALEAGADPHAGVCGGRTGGWGISALEIAEWVGRDEEVEHFLEEAGSVKAEKEDNDEEWGEAVSAWAAKPKQKRRATAAMAAVGPGAGMLRAAIRGELA